MSTDRDYVDSIELVEAVMEWIGMRWTTSMIKRELREYFGQDLSFMTCNFLIKAACKEIRKRYNIDPQYYKGVQIEFYESVIRNKHEKTKNRLTAAERLDKLFGLETLQAEDPALLAEKIIAFKKAIKNTIKGKPSDDGNEQRSEDDGQRTDDDETTDRGNEINKKENTLKQTESEVNKKDKSGNTEPGVDSVTENDELLKEAVEEIKSISDEDLKRFRKKKN